MDGGDDRAGDGGPERLHRASAYKSKRYPAELVEYMRGHGRSKVLFGSNFPMITPAECLADLESLGMGAEARSLFLGGNAARVFGVSRG